MLTTSSVTGNSNSIVYSYAYGSYNSAFSPFFTHHALFLLVGIPSRREKLAKFVREITAPPTFVNTRSWDEGDLFTFTVVGCGQIIINIHATHPHSTVSSSICASLLPDSATDRATDHFFTAPLPSSRPKYTLMYANALHMYDVVMHEIFSKSYFWLVICYPDAGVDADLFLRTKTGGT